MPDDLLTALKFTYNDLTLRPATVPDVASLLSVYSPDVDLGVSLPPLRPDPTALQARLEQRIRSQAHPTAPGSGTSTWSQKARSAPLSGGRRLVADDFTNTGQVETTSWVTRTARNQGLGTTIRIAALTLAFNGLGATTALSRSEPRNTAATRTSERIGYVYTCSSRTTAGDGRDVMYEHFVLDHGAWQTLGQSGELQGIDQFRRWLETTAEPHT